MGELITAYDEKYMAYRRDESRMEGAFESISFPEKEEEAAEILRLCAEKNVPVTVQGARTGICGAAVPAGGHVLCTEKMNKVLKVSEEDGAAYLTAQPGLRISEIREALGREGIRGYRLACAPTEETAAIGGAYACNAKGPGGLLHGDIGDSVCGIRFLSPDGRAFSIRRGEYLFDGDGITLPGGTRAALVDLPEKAWFTKGPFGLYRGMDLIDALAGSEGTLGFVTELRLRLEPEAAERWGVLFFFPEEEELLQFLEGILPLRETGFEDGGNAKIAAVEFYHRTALLLIDEARGQIEALRRVPDFPVGADCALYVELEAADDASDALGELLMRFEEAGGTEEFTWAGTGSQEMEKFVSMRHAVPEAVNTRVDRNRLAAPEICKIGCDLQAPVQKLREVLVMYEKGLADTGIPGVIFGHIAEAHLHVNLLPENTETFGKAVDLADSWAEKVCSMGGTAAAENGVGKRKRILFLTHTDPQRIRNAQKLKKAMDPMNLLGPGNLYPGSHREETDN